MSAVRTHCVQTAQARVPTYARNTPLAQYVNVLTRSKAPVLPPRGISSAARATSLGTSGTDMLRPTPVPGFVDVFWSCRWGTSLNQATKTPNRGVRETRRNTSPNG